MGEPKKTGETKVSQGVLLPPHLRDPAREEVNRNAAPAAAVPDGSDGQPQAASLAALPCTKTEGICALRTTPGARFQCIFSGRGCKYLNSARGNPIAGVPQVPSSVTLITTPHPETGESPRWYLPDGRPVYRDALIKRWEALGRTAIALSKAVTVVDLPKWLAQDDVPIPPRLKWGTWRLGLDDLARVVDFLSEKGEETPDVKSDPASGIFEERRP